MSSVGITGLQAGEDVKIHCFVTVLTSAEGLLGAAPRPCGVALKGARRRCGVVEPSFFSVGGSPER